MFSRIVIFKMLQFLLKLKKFRKPNSNIHKEHQQSMKNIDHCHIFDLIYNLTSINSYIHC